jgi:hypothetical protein
MITICGVLTRHCGVGNRVVAIRNGRHCPIPWRLEGVRSVGAVKWFDVGQRRLLGHTGEGGDFET